MTIRELINELSKVDGDLLDYEVWFTFTHQLTGDMKISGRCNLKELPGNVDIDNERIYIKTRWSEK